MKQEPVDLNSRFTLKKLYNQLAVVQGDKLADNKMNKNEKNENESGLIETVEGKLECLQKMRKLNLRGFRKK